MKELDPADTYGLKQDDVQLSCGSILKVSAQQAGRLPCLPALDKSESTNLSVQRLMAGGVRPATRSAIFG